MAVAQFIGYNPNITFKNISGATAIGSVQSWQNATTSNTTGGLFPSTSSTAPYCIPISYKYILEGYGKDIQLPINSEFKLPDGSILKIDDKGNYQIEDKDAKVTYQANRIREFSPYLNASDLLAQFVKYVGSLGVKSGEVLSLPIELFINWLVIEAAERDKDPLPDGVVSIEKHKIIRQLKKPKCLQCGKFIPPIHAKNRFLFCGIEHGSRYAKKVNPALQLPYVG